MRTNPSALAWERACWESLSSLVSLLMGGVSQREQHLDLDCLTAILDSGKQALEAEGALREACPAQG